ncbi:MAG: hypothetical protein WAO12_03380 [Venatoribacter sp.]
MKNTGYKIITLAFWVLAIYIWWQGWESIYIIPQIALVVAGVHLLEVAFFWLFHRAKSNYPRLDAAGVFIFGVFHLLPIMRRPVF